MDMLRQLNLKFKNGVAVLVLKTTHDSNFTLLVVAWYWPEDWIHQVSKMQLGWNVLN